MTQKSERRIEKKTSRTAEFTCFSRACSYLESDSFYHSDDYISIRLIPKMLKLLIKSGFIRHFFMKKMGPTGIYEYVIARTKYFDEITKKTLDSGIEQVLIFGAGFDSRAIRFHEFAPDVKFFELDSPTTQNAKIKQYHDRNIPVNPNLIFISINFEKETILERLNDCGFHHGKKSLFILEGLIMYLNEKSVEETFNAVSQFAGSGSIIIFDSLFKNVIKNGDIYYGGRDISKLATKSKESYQFGLEKEDLDKFLEKFELTLLETLDADSLEKRYFEDNLGVHIDGKMNNTHFIILVEKKKKNF